MRLNNELPLTFNTIQIMLAFTQKAKWVSPLITHGSVTAASLVFICSNQPEYVLHITYKAGNVCVWGSLQPRTELITHQRLRLFPTSLFSFASPLCMFMNTFPPVSAQQRQRETNYRTLHCGSLLRIVWQQTRKRRKKKKKKRDT